MRLVVLLSYFPAVLGLIITGVFVFVKNYRNRVNVLFFLLSTTIALWLATLLVADLALDQTVSLWALRIGNLVGVLMAPFMLLFCIYFPVSSTKISLRKQMLLILPTAVFMLFALTPYIIPAVDLRDGSAQPVDLGLMYDFETLYIIMMWLLGFALILKKYRLVGARQKTQIRFLLVGAVIALMVNTSTGYVLTLLRISNNFSNFIGSISVFIFCLFVAYTIVRYRLFDIRLAIVRFAGYALTVTIIASFYSLIVTAFTAHISDLDEENYQSLIIALFFSTILITLTAHKIQTYVERITYRLFYQISYDEREILDKLADALVRDTSVEEIIKKSLSILSNAIRPEKTSFVVLGPDHKIQTHFSVNFHGDVSHLAPLVTEERRIIVLDRQEYPNKPLSPALEQLDMELLLRLSDGDGSTGFVLFGSKKNGSMYTRQDIRLLQIASKNLSIALENAKKYEEISHFAGILQEEVNHATYRLKQANKKLRALDKLKDDFISMASHQFRTPASSIRQALHMINNPTLSSSDRKEMLKLAEASSEQLVTIVSTMLSISRLQAGRFTIDKSLANMNHLVEKVMLSTNILAEQKGITIKLEKPEQNIMVNVDVAKINEAMSNYIENAIKYSSSGSAITVRLRIENGQIHFEVLDAGMGVPKEEQQHLFTKFYRAHNARTEQPDGNGIGLYVVKNIAEGHDGKAYYQPLEQGSLFGFWLPV